MTLDNELGSVPELPVAPLLTDTEVVLSDGQNGVETIDSTSVMQDRAIQLPVLGCDNRIRTPGAGSVLSDQSQDFYGEGIVIRSHWTEFSDG